MEILLVADKLNPYSINMFKVRITDWENTILPKLDMPTVFIRYGVSNSGINKFADCIQPSKAKFLANVFVVNFFIIEITSFCKLFGSIVIENVLCRLVDINVLGIVAGLAIGYYSKISSFFFKFL